MAPERLHAFFSGHVQGVGFRYRSASTAARFSGITGEVRNLDDGRVELTAEGERAALDAFLEGLRRAMSEYIRDVEVSWSGATGEFSGFGIAR